MTTVVVKSESSKGYQHEIKGEKHAWTADIPESKGGSDTGPDPHELLLGALGACTSMTIRMFAAKRGWDVKAVSVKLEEKTVEENGKKHSLITRDIEVHGDLNAEQVESLKSIADKCPIHKILVGEKQINTTLQTASKQPA